MSAVAETSTAAATPASTAAAARGGWLFGPWLDLLFVANLAWPAVLLLELWGGFEARDGVRFWQVYFVTTPHRWITLALVFLDRERFRQRSLAYVAVAVGVTALCLSVRATTGALTCLLTVDYIWNAWHFAAQHHGIYRIYGRLSEPERARGLRLEKIGIRTLVIYVTLRVAGWSWKFEALDEFLRNFDLAVLAVPILLVSNELRRATTAGRGRLLYLTSVCTLYVAMLLAVRQREPALVLMLATASALFHATEYLAVVSWAVRRKHGRDSESRGLFATLVSRWVLSLTVFAVAFGLAAWTLERQVAELWLLLNLVAAFLHYSYDAMIWKVRRPGSYAN